MPTINVWSKVAVAVQTALAAAKTITAITKANPPVATSTAHGYTNGQEALLKLTGMTELNNAVVVVDNVTANTFEIKGWDSTNFGTFATGTAELITFGAQAATVTDVSRSGGEPKPIDVTTIHDETDKEVPGNFAAVTYSMDNLWDPADPALVELRKASQVKGRRAMRVTFSTSAKFYFDSHPSALLAPGGSAGDKVTTPASFRLTGPISAYAS